MTSRLLRFHQAKNADVVSRYGNASKSGAQTVVWLQDCLSDCHLSVHSYDEPPNPYEEHPSPMTDGADDSSISNVLRHNDALDSNHSGLHEDDSEGEVIYIRDYDFGPPSNYRAVLHCTSPAHDLFAFHARASGYPCGEDDNEPFPECSSSLWICPRTTSLNYKGSPSSAYPLESSDIDVTYLPYWDYITQREELLGNTGWVGK